MVIERDKLFPDHRPSRWYRECDCLHPDLLDEAVPEDVAAAFIAEGRTIDRTLTTASNGVIDRRWSS